MILVGDALDVLRTLPDESAQVCVTSPAYWGLRDYGAPGQIGLEARPEQYVEKLVDIFAEVRRVLRRDGTLWLNLGDCDPFAGAGTVGLVAVRLGRSSTLVELNPKYAEIARERIRADAPLFAEPLAPTAPTLPFDAPNPLDRTGQAQ